MNKHLTLSGLQTVLPPIKHLIDKKAENVDWNENDPNSRGYIKNRPFYSYEEVIKGEYFLEETTFTGEQQGDNLYAYLFPEDLLNFELLERLFPSYSDLESAEFIVSYDNEDYKTKCAFPLNDMNNPPFLGNLSLIDAGEDTGEPFVFGLAMGQVGVTTPGEHTISVRLADSVVKEYVKIDEKFLPEYQGGQIGMAGEAEGAEIFNDYENNKATGNFSHVEGCETTASGFTSHAEGYSTTADGDYSHAEGYGTTAGGTAHAEGGFTNASGANAHAEGYQTKATNQSSHAEGYYTEAKGEKSHAEGEETKASNTRAHAEGYKTKATGSNSHSEGFSSEASGSSSHAEGGYTEALGDFSHAEGRYAKAYGDYSHVEGETIAYGDSSHAEGGGGIIVDGIPIIISGDANSSTYSIESGDITIGNVYIYNEILQKAIEVESNQVTFSGTFSPSALTSVELKRVEGVSYGMRSHSEGNYCNAVGRDSHAEGHNTIALGNYSHSEGLRSKASGENSHAEGSNTFAKEYASHAEGSYTSASGEHSHAEGYRTIAAGSGSHAEGYGAEALGDYSHSQGYHTLASCCYQMVSGKCNKKDETPYIIKESSGIGMSLDATSTYYLLTGDPVFDETNGTFSFSDVEPVTISSLALNSVFSKEETNITSYFKISRVTGTNAEGYPIQIDHKFYESISPAQQQGKYVHIVGNGTDSSRSNAHTLDWSGNAWYQGDVYVGGTGQDDAAAKKLATEEFVAAPKSSFTLVDEVTGENYVVCIRNGSLVTYKAE